MHLFMRNIGLYFVFVFVPAITWGQTFFPILEDHTRKYKISRQDTIVDHWGEMLKINADLTIVNWGDDPYHMYDIKFAEARMRGDTIIIQIHDTNTIFDYKYDLKIIQDKFLVDFWYQTTIDTAVRKIETVEGNLTLRNKRYKKGSELIGYTEYKGRCVTYFDKDKIYIIKGTFKVRLE